MEAENPLLFGKKKQTNITEYNFKNKIMSHTKGKWFIERTSNEEGDFQCRILCESSEQRSHESSYKEPQIFIIVGECNKRNGVANIHHLGNAKLISAAPDLLEALQFCKSVIESNGLFDMSERMAFEKATNAINKVIQ